MFEIGANIVIMLSLIAFILIFSVSFISGMLFTGPFVPTRSKFLDRFSSCVPLKKGMKVYDLGCGDGRVIRHLAKKYDVDATGFEISPLPWLFAKIANIFTRSKSRVHFKSFFKENLESADVIVLYLVPDILKKLSRKILDECREGTYIVSQTFKVPGLEPVSVIKDDSHPTYYIYQR